MTGALRSHVVACRLIPDGIGGVLEICARARYSSQWPPLIASVHAGVRRLLSVCCICIAVAVLLAPGTAAAASDDEWEPATQTDVWEAVVLKQVVSTPALPHDSENCMGSASQWTRAHDQTAVVLRAYRCDSQAIAKRVAGFSVSDAPTPRSVSPSIFGENRDYAYSQTFVGTGIKAVRFWAQGSQVLSLEVYCERLSLAACDELNTSLSRDLATVSGEDVENRDSGGLISSLINVFFGIPVAGWLIFVGLPGFIRWTLLPRFPVPDPPPPGWNPLTAQVKRLKRRSFAFGAVRGLRRALFIALGVVLAMLASPIRPDFSVVSLWVSLAVFVLVVATLYWVAYRLYDPALSVGTEWRSAIRRGDRGYARYLLGHVMRLMSFCAVLFFLTFFVTVFILYYFGGTHSNRGQYLIARLNNRNEAGQRGFMDDFFASALTATHMSAELALLLPILAFVLLTIDRVGLHLLARSITDVTERGRTPHVLYLRSFGDDRVRLQANRMTRRGILGRLSPWRTRPFGEVVISRLRRIGPVIAVENPDRMNPIPTVGPAKTRLPHVGWEKWIVEHAETAMAVAVSATPRKVTCGLLTELEILAEALHHRRIILILGPSRRRSTVSASWGRFCAAAERWRVFANLLPLGANGTTQVIALHPEFGWMAWGARKRSEWTYAAAIDELIHAAQNVWRVDYARQHPNLAEPAGQRPEQP